MVRLMAGKLLAFLLLFAGVPAHALELSDIQVHSALDQPLRASIEIEDASSTELDSLEVKLAEPELYQRLELDYAAILETLSLRLERKADKARIHIASAQPMREPFLDFLLELKWDKGRLVREFVILLDPPSLLRQKLPAVRPPASAGIPAGATTTGGKATAGASAYGPVKRGETLWRIATRLRPPGLTTEQMMLALLDENPQAFVGNNVNRLREGAILRLPDPVRAAQRRSADEALREFARQYQQWLAETRQSGQAGRPVVTPAGNEVPAAATSPRLELLAVDEAAVQGGKGRAGGDSLQALKDKLALVTEAVAVAERRNEELNRRLQLLQRQVEQLLAAKAALESAQAVGAGSDSEAPPRMLSLLGEKPPASGLSQPQMERALAPWWRDPWLLGTLAAALLVTLVLATLLYRAARRGRRAGEQQQDETRGSDSVGLEPLTEMAHEEGAWHGDSHDIDPLIEADLYLLYENFDKAEKLLKEAIEADPGRDELKLKLLETVCKKQDKDAFLDLAEEFFAALEGNRGHPAWSQVVVMAEKLGLMDNPLFTDNPPSRSVPEKPSPFEREDEPGTQLDLARVYLEMGDKEQAREALQQVMQRGSEEQRSQARAWLEQLDKD